MFLYRKRYYYQSKTDKDYKDLSNKRIKIIPKTTKIFCKTSLPRGVVMILFFLKIDIKSKDVACLVGNPTHKKFNYQKNCKLEIHFL